MSFACFLVLIKIKEEFASSLITLFCEHGSNQNGILFVLLRYSSSYIYRATGSACATFGSVFFPHCHKRITYDELFFRIGIW